MFIDKQNKPSMAAKRKMC